MEHDPNRLTGSTEAELQKGANSRAAKATRQYFFTKLREFWWIAAFMLLAVFLVARAVWVNDPDSVVRFGSLVILAGAATNYWMSSAARAELDAAITKGRELSFRSVAAHEARLVLKQASPSTFVTTMAPPSDFGPLLEQLERQKRPFVFLEIGLVLIGTATTVFGDWFTMLIHNGVAGTC